GAVEPAVRTVGGAGRPGGERARSGDGRVRRAGRVGRDPGAGAPGGGTAAFRGLVRLRTRRGAGSGRSHPVEEGRALRRDRRPRRPRRAPALRHGPAPGTLACVMLYDCSRAAERDRGIAAAVEAVQRGDLLVMPTDTVYGIGADAFKSWSVTALLNAKGRGRDMPPPVLVGSRHTLDGLVFDLPRTARDLVEAFWPGALTIVVEHASSLQWDLGDTGGTVAVRMPLHPVALEVLREAGPMAVSSA